MNRLSIDSFKFSAKKRALLELMLQEAGVERTTVPVILHREGADAVASSFGQQRLWFLQQLDDHLSVYNERLAIRLTGPLDAPALLQSFKIVVQRHEILRTTFVVDKGQVMQVTAPDSTIALPLTDLCHLSPGKREAEAHRLISETVNLPFDLSRGPLLRTALLQLADDEHILLVTMHHIISDGWSLGVLVREIAALYPAIAGGTEPAQVAGTLERLPIQYADFAVWQREWLSGEVLQRQLSYWKEQLQGAAPVLDLPTDKPRAAVQSFKGATQSLELDAELSAALKELSRREGVTLFMTLLAGFTVLLWRYSRQADISIGTPVAGRTQLETEGLIGFFVNTLVLRTEVRGGESFRELLQRVREVALGAYGHQEVPFEKLVEELQPERELSRSPLFQVMFVLQNVPREELQMGQLRVQVLAVPSETAKFDLTLMVEERGSRLQVGLEYRSELFSAESMKRMLEHYQVLLAAAVADAGQQVGRMALLAEQERRQLLHEWNATEVHYDQAHCIHELVEAQVERTPEAIAVVYEQERLSYEELNARANQLAHYLQRQGIGSESLVGILMERSVELVVALLAVLKAGAAYVPLDPAYPSERLSFMIEDAGVGLVLSQESLQHRLSEHQGLRIANVESEWEQIANESSAPVASEVSADNLAYVIYTSGSIGKPKGVMVTHRNVLRLFSATDEWFHFDDRDVWTLFHSYAFDFSVWELWGALLYGGRLVIVPYLLSRSPEAFYQLLIKERVTVLNQTPSAFRQLIAAEENAGAQSSDLALRAVIFGGEALEIQSLKPWFERHGDQRPLLVNMYGITETTVHVTYRPLSLADVRVSQGSVIGKPIPDLQVYVLDAYMQPVPLGVTGEMYVGGDGVARGYLGQPALTATRFVPHPFSTKPGSLLYRTGDLARYLPNGEFEYLGRIDHQVKIRGFRIELGEIEAVLSNQAGVREALVVAREDSPGEKRLVAYLVLDQEQLTAIGELRRLLKTSLPDYMIPSAFIVLEALPLTSNGKVDHRALPAPDGARPELERVYVAPSTPTEKLLVGVWTEALGIEQVGIHDNYFELGGDSIRSVGLLAQAKERGLDFSLQQLFQHQTIYELAREIDAGIQSNGPTPDLVADRLPFTLLSEADRLKLPVGLEEAYPLTMMQAGMLFHSEYSPGSSVYHNITSFCLRAPFNQKALETALRALIARHPVLRTSFDLMNYSEPVQLVHFDVPLPLCVEDLRGLTQTQQQDVLAESFEAEKNLKFDWRQAPLFQVRVERRTEETFQFTLTQHHAILDGWSVATLLSELFTEYSALLNGESQSAKTELANSFRDFIELERLSLQSEASRNFWNELLRDSVVTTLPSFQKSNIRTGKEMRVVEVPISRNVSDGLKALAQSTGVPLKSVLLAAHLRIMRLLGGHDDVLTGVVTHGRPEGTDGERTAGLFLNTLPFRQRLSGGTWTDLVREVFETELAMLPHRRYPLAQIQNEHGHSLLDTFFNFTNFHVYEALKNNSTVEVMEARSFSDSSFAFVVDFSLDLRPSDVTLLVSSGETSDLTDRQLKTIGGYYSNALQSMADDPFSRYESLCFLGTKEREQILEHWNQTQSDSPAAGRLLHEWFEAQAQRTPGSPALAFAKQQLTYRELNEKANQLAHHLRSLGVGPEVRAGIILTRSPLMLIGLLAVLKAGGAYVPLDPNYPHERVSLMLTDADIHVLLTEEDLLTHIPPTQAAVLVLDKEWPSHCNTDNPACIACSENLAYVIYTSGSTGIPKGVAITHRSASAFISWSIDFFTRERLQAVLASTSINFDLSVFELFAPLSIGGCVVLAENALHLPTLESAVKVELINTVPSAMAELVRQHAVPPSVRVVNLAGEALSRTLVQDIYSVETVEQVINLYGPSEDTTYTTYEVVSEAADEPVLIGRPVSNTQIYLLDKEMQPVPIGVAGELYTSGEGLARGYLNRPALTAEKFIPNPYSQQPGARLYRTGDLTRYREDGRIEYLARVDQQVKVRGFRIELGEIEVVLQKHPIVRQCALTISEDESGDKRLVAYLVLHGSETATGNEFRAYLKEKLPDYMVPQIFVTLSEMPLTPNGKIDRKRLPAAEQVRTETEEAFVAPRTQVEKVVTGIIAVVLKLKRVGVNDNFLDLGGHSLLATQVIFRLRAAIKTEIPLRSLFTAPTLAEFAAGIEGELRNHKGSQLPPIEPVTRAELPLSFAQQRLFFLDQLAPGSSFYNLPGAVRLSGKLNLSALSKSLSEVVGRHEALRTTFSMNGGEPVQVVHAATEFRLRLTDLSQLEESERESEVERLVRVEASAPFDLVVGPLLRAQVIRLGAAEHVVLLTMHHIISDGWSTGVLIREIAALYPAIASGAEPAQAAGALERLPIQYADYAVWQREWFSGEVLERQLSYWKEQLQGAAPVLELPADKPRAAVQSFKGATQSLELDAELSAALKELSRREGVTLFMTLLAGFTVLLWRYSRQADISIGTPVAGRTQLETEGLIGFFVNTLVLRTEVRGAESFRELLQRVREVAISGYSHQEVPFEKVVEELQPERELSRSPLFQVMFSLQNIPREELKMGQLRVQVLEVVSETAKFELSLVVDERATGLQVGLEYRSELFSAESMERMLEHYRILLAAVVAEPECLVQDLRLMSNAERSQVLEEWNATEVDYDQTHCIHELVEAQVERTPAAIAVVYEQEQLSYRELNERANQLAHYLQSGGVGPESLVGILMDRSVEQVVALLAVLKAGAAYVPLDPAYPRERLSFMIEDAAVGLLLTHQQLDQRVSVGAEVQVINVESQWAKVAGQSKQNPGSSVSADNLAYVIYTSGSTGRPKGVMISHRSLQNLVFWHQSFQQLSALDRGTLVASPAFDASVLETWPYLSAGAALYLPPEETRVTPAKLRDWLIRHSITISFMPTPLAERVLSEEWTERGKLRSLLTGGDRLSHYPSAGFEVSNHYGPTESTVVTSCMRLQGGQQGGVSGPPIGRPISNTEVYILDTEMQPVPVGVSGELYIGGVGLARGYWRRPKLTAERFIPHRFSREAGARLYQTGDLARYLADGNIEYLGRADTQVKVRGYRIELGEIETVLGKQTGVRQCAVLVRKEGAAEKQLVAYVVGTADASLKVSELRRALKEQLPDYMIPTAFVLLDELPLTTNGKLDRRSLQELAVPHLSLETSYLAPRTTVEEILANVWSQVLEVDQVGIEDNFFELGGHSLLAMQVISRIRDAVQVELPLRGLFEAPTVGGLALLVEERMKDKVDAPPIRVVSRAGRLPLSFAQQRLWFLDQLEPGNSFYNIAGAVRLSGELNLSGLSKSLTEIVGRHEALRTTFSVSEGEPVQVVHAATEFCLRLIDLSQLEESEREAEVDRIARVEAGEPFDLVVGPLLRAQVIRLGEAEHVVLLTMHHIISDGWSMGVLVKEIAALYPAIAGGTEPAEAAGALERLPIQYADYAVWQREWLSEEVLERQVSYWKEQLQEAAPVLELPTDKPRPVVQSFKGATQSLELDAELSAALKELSRREGVTLFMTLLAGFTVLLWRYSGQADISIGTPVAGRTQLETEGLIGFFVNTLVLRTEVRGAESFRELLQRVREVALGAYSHQEVPFEKLVEELQPERELSRSPLFQVMFVLQNMAREHLTLSGIELSTMGVAGRTAKFDLTLTVIEEAVRMSGAIEYNTELFEAETIRRMVEHYRILLATAVADAGQQVGRMALLAEQERRQLLHEWNATAVRYEGEDLCLHELIEAQVERTPKAIAVVYEQEQLNYWELNARANQLAHYLQRQGIGPESLAGILMERSVELVVALLAVLKAGAAYVPLDPAYPHERLSFMLEETGTRVLLTQQRLVDHLPAHQGQVLCLDTEWSKVAAEAKQNPQSGVRGANLAYVIYTSGSTGKPKAAMNSHRGIVNRLLWMQEQYQLKSSDRVLQKTPYSFDVSVWEFFWPLLTGAAVVLARPEGHREPDYLVELIAAEQVTVLHFVPSMLAAFLEAAAVAERCGSVRQVICSGEELKAEVARRCQERLDGELDNLYGPTEAAVDVTAWRCERGRGEAVAIGKPIANIELYILDREGEPVPVGVSGELHIGGVGLARGYWQRPELTAERFIPHGYSREAGARLYRTGDLARYRADGNIEYLGRLDTQVKVRGYRIELGEIETVLAQHAGVRQSAVIVRADGTEKQLVAYVVESEAGSVDVSQVRRSLREQLPDYMIPAAFVLLDELPLTTNGKLDRRALPAHDSTRPQLENMFIAPRTPVEAELSAIWCELLHLDQVSVSDNFFELGGHSLLLTQFVSRVRQAYQVELPLRMLFDAPNIEDMTMVLATRQIEQEDRTIVLRMLEELEQLSVAEVQAQLEVEKLNNFPMHTIAF